MMGRFYSTYQARRSYPMLTPKNLHGMNVLLFITDQQRAIQHFPPHWAETNLPRLQRLQRHGVTFERAFLQFGHVLSQPRDLDDRLLSGAARRQVDPRDRHARASISPAE